MIDTTLSALEAALDDLNATASEFKQISSDEEAVREHHSVLDKKIEAISNEIREADFSEETLPYNGFAFNNLVVKLRYALVRNGKSAYELPAEFSVSIDYDSIGQKQRLNTSSAYQASAFVTRLHRRGFEAPSEQATEPSASPDELIPPRGGALQIESAKLSSIKSNDFGIRFQPYYLHVLLFNALHGHKDRVRNEIDRWMKAYGLGMRTLAFDRKHKHQSDVPLLNNATEHEVAEAKLEEIEEADPDLQRQNPLLLEPVHATSLGYFDHCSIFCGPDLRSSRLLMYMEHITAKVSLQGAIPLDIDDDEDRKHIGNGLFQNFPERVLLPFPHEQASEDFRNERSDKKYSDFINPPIVATVQLQINSLLSTSGGLCVVVPMIKIIDRVLRQTAEDSGQQVKGLLALSKNWSSATVILRCEDFDDMVLAINRIAKLTLKDLFAAWPMKLDTQKASTLERLEVLSHALFEAGESQVPDSYDWVESNNHVFARSFSIPSILHPLERDGALCERGVVGKVTAEELELRSERWRLKGDVRTLTRFHTRPGHYNDLALWLQQFSWSGDPLDPDARIKGVNSTVGHYDFSLSDEFFEPRSSKKPGRAFRIMSKLALIQRGLTQGAMDRRIAPGEIDLETPVRDDLPDTPVLMETEIGSTFTSVDKTVTGAAHQDLTQTYDRAVRRYLAVKKANFAELERELRPLLSARGVAHNHVASLLEIGSSWTGGLRALIDADVLVGLASAWEVGLRMLKKLLDDDDSTLQQIQHFITDFTRPFSRAYEHRRVVNNSSSDPGAGFEFNGTLQSATIAMEECLRGFAALVGEQTNSASLAILSNFPDIRMNLHRSPALSEDELEGVRKSEWLYGFVRINYKLAQEPARIHVAIHEMLHVIVASREFGACIQAVQRAEKNSKRRLEDVDLFKVLHSHDRASGQNALWQQRVEEITVEYLLGLIIFSQGDDPELYSKSFAMQLTLEPSANDQADARNNELQVEMLARCLIVTKMLQGMSNWFEWGENESAWFGLVRPYLNPKSFVEGGNVECQLQLTLERWRHSDLDDYLSTIVLSCNHFFGAGRGSGGSRGMRIRRKFMDKLRDTYEKTRQENSESDPSRNFLFHEFSFRRVPEIQEGRVGSLIEFVIAIREYYRNLTNTIEEMTEARDTGCFVLRRNNKGHVDFQVNGGLDGPALLLNVRDSSMFWASPLAEARYTRLRVDFNQSMYHISERSRYREMMWLFNEASREAESH